MEEVPLKDVVTIRVVAVLAGVHVIFEVLVLGEQTVIDNRYVDSLAEVAAVPDFLDVDVLAGGSHACPGVLAGVVQVPLATVEGVVIVGRDVRAGGEKAAILRVHHGSNGVCSGYSACFATYANEACAGFEGGMEREAQCAGQIVRVGNVRFHLCPVCAKERALGLDLITHHLHRHVRGLVHGDAEVVQLPCRVYASTREGTLTQREGRCGGEGTTLCAN